MLLQACDIRQSIQGFLAEQCFVLTGPGKSGHVDDEPDISSDDDRGNNASDVELSD